MASPAGVGAACYARMAKAFRAIRAGGPGKNACARVVFG